ncbi:hypothetical protein CSB11_00275 [Candidatus Campbellbacteria bacterium]|nr:MAG: hypothetical protein CSB11_00275 [Candidatus Campbellbacteria bacterium]
MTNQSRIKKLNKILIKRNKIIFLLFSFSILLFVTSNFYFVYTEAALVSEIKNLDAKLADLTVKKSSIEIEYTENVEKLESIEDKFALTNLKEVEYLNSTDSEFAFKN